MKTRIHPLKNSKLGAIAPLSRGDICKDVNFVVKGSSGIKKWKQLFHGTTFSEASIEFSI